MPNGIVDYIVQILILDPMQSEISEQLKKARVPPEIAAQVNECAQSSLPALVRRATNDPQWAVVVALDVWLKRKTPEQVVEEALPSCKPVVDAARSYFAKEAA